MTQPEPSCNSFSKKTNLAPGYGINAWGLQQGLAWFAVLELRVARSARERDHVANVLHPGEVHHHALEAHSEARMRNSAEPAQIEIPPVGLLAHPVRLDLLQ